MINYHHIGGRNGTFPLPLKTGKLLNDFHLILYDADANCQEQMSKSLQGEWGKISVFPYCIGGQTGRASFHLNFHPTTNSLYPFNDAYAEYGYVNNPLYGEYRLGDACKHIQSIELDLLTLEDVLKQSNVSAVDYLSLDVQGAEYDILHGAKELLQQQCVGVQLEVEFVELYRGQKTFFAIHSLMDEMGFELIDVIGFGRCAPMPLPIGYRGVEQPLSAEGIYLKKLECLIKLGNVEQIYKAAFFSLIYKKTGLCFKYLSAAIALDKKEMTRNEDEPLYKKLMKELWQQYTRDKDYTFPGIGKMFSNEAFQSYYQHGKNTYVLKDRAVKEHVDNLLPHVSSLSKNEISDLETILRKYDLSDVAEVVKSNRLFEAECFLKLGKSMDQPNA